MLNTSLVSGETQIAWESLLKKCNNVLSIDDDTVIKSLETTPPLAYSEKWKKTFGNNAVFLGRYIIPDEFLLYNGEDQPRDKSNVSSHVNEIINSFENQGYRLESQPPIAVPCEELLNPHHVLSLIHI